MAGTVDNSELLEDPSI